MIAEDYRELDLMMQVTISSPIFLCTCLFMFDLYLLTSLTFVQEMAPHAALCSILRLKHSSMKKVLITMARAASPPPPPFFLSPQSTGTDFTATEIKSVAADSGHLNLVLQNAEQTSPYAANYINTCLTSNMLIITDFKESFSLHMNINYGFNLL